MNTSDEKERQESFPWERGKYHTHYNQVLVEYKVRSCLEQAVGDSLLDVACGDGSLTEHFAKHFTSVVGVDASSVHLAEARRRLPRVTFHEALIEEFQTDQTFDSIFLLDLLEHVVDPVAVLRHVAGLLAPGGRLIAHVPNETAVNRQIALRMGTLTSLGELSPFDLEIAGHRRSYSLQTLERDIRAAGLEVVEMGGIFYKMLSTPQMDWFLENGLWASGHGWGRTGMETAKDWRAEFCRACYEYGKERPQDCNVIFACATKGECAGV